MAVVEAGAPVLATTAATAQIVDTALFSAIATTSATTTTAGSSQTITVASGTGIVVGMWLTIDAGAALETVQVTAAAGTSVTAIFANVHTGTYNVVANINRQIVSVGSPSVKTQIAEVDTVNRLNTITPDIVVTGQTLSASATTNNNVIANTAGFGTIAFEVTGGSSGNYAVEGTVDGTSWQNLLNQNILNPQGWSVGGSYTGSSVSLVYYMIVGMQSVRFKCSSTGSGSFAYSYVLTNSNSPALLGMGYNSSNIVRVAGNSIVPNTPADALFNGQTAIQVLGYGVSYNGSSWDRNRKDTYANGPQWMTTGGGSTKYVASGGGTNVIKASAGRLVKVQVTTLGATALTFYDNASAASGNIVGIIPASMAAGGVPIAFDWPCANGITGDFLAGSPAVSIAYW
jgi:hypothetical protein